MNIFIFFPQNLSVTNWAYDSWNPIFTISDSIFFTLENGDKIQISDESDLSLEDILIEEKKIYMTTSGKSESTPIKKNTPIPGAKLVENIGKLKIYQYPEIKLNDIEELNRQKGFPPHVQALIKKDYKDTKRAYEEFLNVDKDPRQVFFLEKLTRAFKDTILFGRIDLRSYILHSSMIRMTLLQRLANKIRGGQ